MLRLAMRHLCFPSSMIFVLASVAACVTPTDACGCVAPPSALRVHGTVRDLRGLPVAEARVSILNRSVGFPNTSFGTLGRLAYTTDSVGDFLAETTNLTPGQYEIRGSIVRRGATDSVVLDLGHAELRSLRGRVDTIRVAVAMP